MTERAVVVLEYADLVNRADVAEKLLEAWGPGSLGIVAVRGVPRWEELYSSVLKLSHRLAHLPDASLKELEHEASMFNAGWSHGKEKLGDKPDLAKGSFYFNPLSDSPGTEEDREKFPWALPKNLWPKDIPDLAPKCKDLGRSMQEVIGHLGHQVDRIMAGRVKGYNAELGKTLSNTEKCKGRLLYYFPPKEAQQPATAVSEDGWIGWHNDSGFMTGLTPDLYVDDDTGSIVENPDPNGAGLWVVDREGGAVHVRIPKDCMAVQVGECVQIVTGGELVATPHCVRGCRPSTTGGRKIARVSCPCFVDTHPAFEFRMPDGASRAEVLARGLSEKVPPLGERWEEGQTFGDFLGASFRRYYDWSISKSDTEKPQKRARSE
mmetsp:Transcript_105323/g.187213  ORF Transcript_105323/g.187213 Transcript_105323/m.187213 type:complete len:378 (+) Transcript_105323:67-1200(+)